MATGDIRLEWNMMALTTVRNSGAVVALEEGFGKQALARANGTLSSISGPNGGYAMSSNPGPGGYNRHVVNVYTRGSDAKRSNAINNTLAKILG